MGPAINLVLASAFLGWVWRLTRTLINYLFLAVLDFFITIQAFPLFSTGKGSLLAVVSSDTKKLKLENFLRISIKLFKKDKNKSQFGSVFFIFLLTSKIFTRKTLFVSSFYTFHSNKQTTYKININRLN